MFGTIQFRFFYLVISCLKTKRSGHKISSPLVTMKAHVLYRMRMFENKVVRRIFGYKRQEVTGGWRKLHKEELHNL